MPYCYNCDVFDEDMEVVCGDCSATLCNKCENDDEVLCKCYGTCDSCECEVNRGSDGRRCMDCQEWLCYDCKRTSECSTCGFGKSSEDEDEEDEDNDNEDTNNIIENANIES